VVLNSEVAGLGRGVLVPLKAVWWDISKFGIVTFDAVVVVP